MFSTPEGPSGYNYFGSFAIALAIGQQKRLHRISNGETDIWTGPVDISSADGDGKTTLATTIGTIDFYWGTATQNVDPLLDSLEIDFGSGPAAVPMSANRHLCYAVCNDVAFGAQTSPPTLKFDLERELELLDISAHTINGDSVIPEAVYDYLTNTLYGGGLDPEVVDEDSFAEAAEVVIAEGLGGSPTIDTAESVRDTIGKMLALIDGVLYWDAGKLKLKLIRSENVIEAPVITEKDMLDEPTPNNKLFGDTWNQTRIVFRDRENKWEEAVECYEDGANFTVTGQYVPRDFQFPWITQRSAAKVLARLTGIKGGVPPIYWDLQLKPAWRTLVPGQLIRLFYPKLGVDDVICRIFEVRRGAPGSPAVSVQAIEDQTRDTSGDYLPADDTFTVPGMLDDAGTGEFAVSPTTPRISILPDGLKPEWYNDGVLLVGNRPDSFATKMSLWWTYDPGAFAYQKLDERTAFPIKATMVCWWRISEDKWLLRIKPDASHDYDALIELVKQHDVLCVVGERKYKSVGAVQNVHQVLAPWMVRPADGRFELVTAEVIDIEMTGAQFDTDDLTLETLGDIANYPTLHVYFGLQPQFLIFPTYTLQIERDGANASDDTDLIRYFKATVANHKNEEVPADVTPVTYDRDDVTMSPEGTFSRDWGARAKTAYEVMDEQLVLKARGDEGDDYLDVEDLDDALGAVIEGTATAEQELLVNHIDNVLGAMIGSSQTWYNE